MKFLLSAICNALEQKDDLKWNDTGYKLDNKMLERISFYGIKLDKLPVELKQEKGLEMLSAVYSNLREMPSWIGELENLQELYIGGNMLQTLPDSIGELSKLKYLYVMEDGLEALPDSIGRLENLKEIVISSKVDVDWGNWIKANHISAEKIVVNDKIINS